MKHTGLYQTLVLVFVLIALVAHEGKLALYSVASANAKVPIPLVKEQSGIEPIGTTDAESWATIHGQPFRDVQTTDTVSVTVPITDVNSSETLSVNEVGGRFVYSAQDFNIYYGEEKTGVVQQITSDASPDDLSIMYLWPEFSPSGQFFAFCKVSRFERTTQLYLVNTSDLVPVLVETILTCEYDWSPDGQFLVFGRPFMDDMGNWVYVSGIWRFDLITRELIELIPSVDAFPLKKPQWSSDGKWILYEKVIEIEGSWPMFAWNTSTGDSFPTPIIGSADWSSDGKMIIFDEVQYVPDTNMGLYVTTPSSGFSRQLVYRGPNYYAMTPRMSPDGTKIAFFQGGESSYYYRDERLVVIDLSGNIITTLDFEIRFFEKWLDDSRRILITYSQGDTAALAIYDLVDGSVDVLVEDAGGGADYWNPSLSPVKRHEILFLSSRDHTAGEAYMASLHPHELYLMQLDGTNQRRVYPGFDVSPNVGRPLVSPDQKTVLIGGDKFHILDESGLRTRDLPEGFSHVWLSEWHETDAILLSLISTADGEFKQEVFRMDSIDGEPVQLTDLGEVSWFASFSPDASQIAFMHDYQLWIMDANGENPRRLIEQLARDLAWSPDGAYIAFEGNHSPSSSSFREYPSDIWLVEADGTNPRNVTNSPDLYEYTPAWSPDSRRLIFEAAGSPNGVPQIYVFDLATGLTTQLTRDRSNRSPVWITSTPGSLTTEKMIQVEPALLYNEQIYRVFLYSTDPEDKSADTILNTLATGTVEMLERMSITKIVVTRDDIPVTDPDELRKVFELYTAAYYLAQNYDLLNHFENHDLATIDQDIKDVLGNLILQVTNLPNILNTPSMRSLHMLRAAITNNNDELGEVVKTIVDDVASGVAVADAAFSVLQLSTDPRIQQTMQLMTEELVNWRILDNKLSIPNIGSDIPLPFSSLEVIQVLVHLYHLDQLSQEYLDLLVDFEQRFDGNDFALNAPQSEAIAKLTAEVQSLGQQRLAFLEDFFVTKLQKGIVSGGTTLAGLLAVELVNRFPSTNISGYMAGSLLASVNLGVSISEFAMQTDLLYEHFQTAEDANALRQQATQARQWTVALYDTFRDEPFYNGRLAESYAIALKTEMLMANQVRESYTDGTAATIERGLLNLVTKFISWWHQDDNWDWSEIVKDLRQYAASRMTEFDQRFMNRAAIPYLVSLAQQGADGTIHAQRAEPRTILDSARSGVPDHGVPMDPGNILARRGTVTASLLNVRSTPSLDAAVLTGVAAGTVVSILGESEDGQWLNVSLPDGQVGWVAAAYVQDAADESNGLSSPSIPPVSTLPVAPSCATPVDPAFTGIWSQSEIGCATSTRYTTFAAWQPFERGYMLWRKDQSSIYALYNSREWGIFNDQWAGESPSNRYGSPPPGLLAPVRGFGFVWERYDEVFPGLGWATGGEKGVCLIVQNFEGGFLAVASSGANCPGEPHSHAGEPDFGLSTLKVMRNHWSR